MSAEGYARWYMTKQLPIQVAMPKITPFGPFQILHSLNSTISGTVHQHTGERCIPVEAPSLDVELSLLEHHDAWNLTFGDTPGHSSATLVVELPGARLLSQLPGRLLAVQALP